jgi:uncharacterized protein (DUF2252 family)
VSAPSTAPRRVPHPSLAERAAAGKAARSRAPRTSHGDLAGRPDRDPVGQIERENEGRLQELVPIRHGRMLASPFAFYRGTASLMAADLAAAPHTGLRVQLCGDAHLSNFGAFASPDRTLVLDLNDFDETLPGPFEWDVKRLAASFELAGRHRGFDAALREASVLRSVASYRNAMRGFAEVGNLAVWYARLDASAIVDRLVAAGDARRARRLERAVEKAQVRDSARALTRLTEVVDGEVRLLSQPPLLVPIGELAGPELDPEALRWTLFDLLRRYRQSLQADRRRLLESYRLVDAARKVVGVGSVGTRCWVVLLLGRDDADPLVLQVKEAGPSVLEQHLGRSTYGNAGRRVVEGQRLMQAASDIFLGWIHNPAALEGGSRDFYVRQLWDWKASVDVESIEPEGLLAYAEVCGWTLARAHARSGDRVAISAYLGKSDVFDQAVGRFAVACADRAEADFAALAAAVADGRVAAVDA